MNRYDIRNIARDFGLQSASINHADDAASIRIWVEKVRVAAECDQNCDSCVRFVKFQGEQSISDDGELTTGACCNEHMHCIANDDFYLIIMTDVQVHMLATFGVNGVVCVDSAHGTNAYDFQLTTLMIIDDHEEGFPVDFCYSNHVNQESMEIFFSHSQPNCQLLFI